MSDELTLYHYWRSSSSWRVRWALELKTLKAKMVHVDLLGGEVEREPHLSRNPLGYVPVLETNGRLLIESAAICEWLDETHPEPGRLYPGDSFQRAHIRALVEIVNASIQPVQNLNVLDKRSADPVVRKEWSQFFIRRGFQAYEKLAARSAGKFSVGDTVTAADLFLIPQCYNARRNEMDLAEFPLLARIHEAAMKTPEAQTSAPEKYEPK